MSALVGLVLLLLVAALARDAGDAGPSAASGDVVTPIDLYPVFVALGMVLMGATLIAAVAVGVLDRGRGRGRWPVRPLVMALALMALAWLLSMLPARSPVEPEAGPDPPDDAPARERTTTDRDWLPSGPLLLVVVVAMAAGGVVITRFVRAGGDDDEVANEEGDEEEAAGTSAARHRLVTGLDEVIDALRHDPDPRRAVIVAWARLEDLLAEHRLPRRPSEAPTGYVGRVLGRLATSGSAVQALTTTFERAMFSPHVIERADQVAAVDALLAVRNDLTAKV